MVSDKSVATIRTATLQIDISNEISDALRLDHSEVSHAGRCCWYSPRCSCCGTVDLRKGIDGLATIIGDKYGQNPFEKGTLFLFCGKRSDRCKGLLWMGTGFLLLYKRFEAGRLSWPRNTQEAADLTEEQYKYLMMGLNPLDPKIKMLIRKKYIEMFVQNRENTFLFLHRKELPSFSADAWTRTILSPAVRQE